jgi:homoserine O-acetyltransferase
MEMVAQPRIETDFVLSSEHLPFRLQAGGELPEVRLRYSIYGELNAERDNAVLVCHALSGSSRVADWWPEMIGPGATLDTTKYCVIGINILGSCYGSTGPRSIDPRTGEPYNATFPVVNVYDIVRSQALLLDHLGISKVCAVVGGSIGGMQALEWAVQFPTRVERCVAIGAAPLSSMGLALNHVQRLAIQNDPAWKQGNYPADRQPEAGLALARGVGMCTYKSPQLFAERFARKPNRNGEDPHRHLTARFDIAGYLDYQGEIFHKRFDANAYLMMLKVMDTFELGHTPEEEAEALKRIRAEVLLVGISTDWLFPPEDVKALAQRARDAGVTVRYTEFQSAHGHDAFLAEADVLAPSVAQALARQVSPHSKPVHLAWNRLARNCKEPRNAARQTN